MPSALIFMDDLENRIVEEMSKRWKLSKNETVRKIISEFKTGDEQCPIIS